MRLTLTRLRQSHGWFLDRSQMTSGPLAWVIIVLVVAAFLLPYFLFPHLSANGVAYGTLSLVPVSLAAFLRGHRGVFITWGMLVLGFLCSFWLSYGLSGPSSAIMNNFFGYGAELPMGLAGAQFIRMHRQIIANRLVSQEQEQQISHQQQVSELKDLLIMNLSHELRTPLTGLYGYLELLGDYDQQLDEAMRTTFLTHARKECSDLIELISNLLDTHQFAEKERRVPCESIPVAPFVRQWLDQWNIPLQQDHEIVLVVPEGLAVQANPQYLRQILRNLLSNAIKYSPSHSHIVISAKINETAIQETASSLQVCISVKDEGPGILPADIPLLFNKFVRLKRDLAGQVRGSGLGLYISKQLVEAMQGQIWVESSGVVGEGSRFCLLLPSASPSLVVTE